MSSNHTQAHLWNGLASLLMLMGGFLLAVLALLAILAGPMLALLVAGMLLLVGVALSGFALVWGSVALVRGLSPRAKPTPGPTTVPEAPPAPATPVVATLLAMEGACARKVRYAVGNSFTFEDGRVQPAMCGPALHALRPVVAEVRTTRGARLARLQCPLSGSVLVFEVKAQERRPAQRAA
ncbi:hypothetical protein HRbin23_01575 [bacterium HR23]|nr:hypothetical protein HRbin23_01575 [bacterium HR23]